VADFTSIISSGAARSAYRSTQSLAANRTEPLKAPEPSDKATFADALRDAAQQATQDIRQAEVTAQAGMSGSVSTQAVIESTIALESTVKVAVTMRDKLVEAYKEVLRMPI